MTEQGVASSCCGITQATRDRSKPWGQIPYFKGVNLFGWTATTGLADMCGFEGTREPRSFREVRIEPTRGLTSSKMESPPSARSWDIEPRLAEFFVEAHLLRQLHQAVGVVVLVEEACSLVCDAPRTFSAPTSLRADFLPFLMRHHSSFPPINRSSVSRSRMSRRRHSLNRTASYCLSLLSCLRSTM